MTREERKEFIARTIAQVNTDWQAKIDVIAARWEDDIDSERSEARNEGYDTGYQAASDICAGPCCT